MQRMRVCLVEGQATAEVLHGTRDVGRKRERFECLVLRGDGPWRLDVQVPPRQRVDVDLTRGGAM